MGVYRGDITAKYLHSITANTNISRNLKNKKFEQEQMYNTEKFKTKSYPMS